MKKKLFLMVALVLCAVGSAFADKYYKSEAEFYRDMEKAASKYKFFYVVDVFEKSEVTGFACSFEDDGEVYYFGGKSNECVYAFFCDHWETVEDTLPEMFENYSFHWWEDHKGYDKAMLLFKTLVEVSR